jgi:DNA-binding LacI/PurR family transcriptional regulator
LAQPTISDVARLAGTTPATVSRVINNSGYVSARARAAVLDAVEQLHYVPNANARVLKTKRSHVIGILTGDLFNPYSVTLAGAVQAHAEARGYTTFMAAAGDAADSEVRALEAFHRQRLAGVIVASLQTPASDHLLLRLAEQSLPLVLVGRQLAHPRIDTISANFRRGGTLATQHLIATGHRRIAFIGANLADMPRIGRFQGYLDALGEAGLAVRDDLIVGQPRVTPNPKYSTQIDGYRAMQQLLKLPSRPTAIFARNDYTAIGALQALKEAGLRTPDDVAVAGFDDIPLAAAMSPSLTTVSQPTDDEGRFAAEFLLERIERADGDTARREILLECNLIVRASTAGREAEIHGKTETHGKTDAHAKTESNVRSRG